MLRREMLAYAPPAVVTKFSFFFFCTMSFTEHAVVLLQDDVDYTVLLNILKKKLKRKPFESLEAYLYHLNSVPPSHLIIIFPLSYVYLSQG